jgi:hypothetical protein
MSGGKNNYSLEYLQIISNQSGRNVDLIPYMHGIEIYEDIHSPFLHAQVDLVETESIIETLPMVGDEFVVAVLRQHGVLDTSQEFITFNMDVYKIEDEQKHKHKATQFRIKLISRSFKKNASKRTRNYYVGTQDLITSEIVGEQLEQPMARVDPCMFEEEYIFPNWHPIGCINKLSQNSVSLFYQDSDYVFYEDLEGFHYLSMSYMMDKGNGEVIPFTGGFFKSPVVSEFLNEKLEFTVSDYHKKHAFDVIDNTNKGMYGATTVYNDVLNRWVDEDASNYLENFYGFGFHLSNLPLMEPLYKDGTEKNRMINMPVNGLENPGPYTDLFYPLQRRNLVMRQMQSEQNTMVLEIEGEPKLDVGKPMGFELISIKEHDRDTLNDKLFGYFLITRIRHVFARDKYIQYVEIAKDSYFK